MRSCVMAGPLALFGFAIAAGAAWPAGYPAVKAGLWHVTITNVGSRLPPQTAQFCVDARTQAVLLGAGQEAAKQACSKQAFQVSGPVATSDAVCKLGQSTVTTHARTVFNGDNAYHTDVQAHFDPPLFGKTASASTRDGSWAGPCPPGMLPGDMVTGAGIKMRLQPGG